MLPDEANDELCLFWCDLGLYILWIFSNRNQTFTMIRHAEQRVFPCTDTAQIANHIRRYRMLANE